MPLVQTDLGKFKRQKVHTKEYQSFMDITRTKTKHQPRQRAVKRKIAGAQSECDAMDTVADTAAENDTVLLLSPVQNDPLTEMLMCHETLDDSAYDPYVPFSKLYRGKRALAITIRAGESFGPVRFEKCNLAHPTPSPRSPETPCASKKLEDKEHKSVASPPNTENRKRRVKQTIAACAPPKKPRGVKMSKKSIENRLMVAAALSANAEDATRFQLCEPPCEVVDNAAYRLSPNPLDGFVQSPSNHQTGTGFQFVQSHDLLEEVESTLELFGDVFDQFV
jgi:hypothetical protein